MCGKYSIVIEHFQGISQKKLEMNFSFHRIFAPLYHLPAGLVALELKIRPVRCNLHLRRGCHVHSDIIERHLELAVVVPAENVLEILELREHIADFHHVPQVVVQVHELVVAKTGRVVHEQNDFAIDLRNFGFEPVELVARNFAAGTVQEEYGLALEVETVIALAVLDGNVKIFRHHVDIVVIAGNNAHGAFKQLDLVSDKLVGARFCIFICKVARKDEQVQFLHGFGIQCIQKIFAHIDVLHKTFVFANMDIRYLSYLQQNVDLFIVHLIYKIWLCLYQEKNNFTYTSVM